jgi:hypothetical protein
MATAHSNFIRFFSINLSAIALGEGYVSSTGTTNNPWYTVPPGKVALIWVVITFTGEVRITSPLGASGAQTQTGDYYSFIPPLIFNPVIPSNGKWVVMGEGDRIYRNSNNAVGWFDSIIYIKEFASGL